MPYELFLSKDPGSSLHAKWTEIFNFWNNSRGGINDCVLDHLIFIPIYTTNNVGSSHGGSNLLRGNDVRKMTLRSP